MKVLLKKISLWHWEKSLLVIENSLLVMACKGVYLQMELFAYVEVYRKFLLYIKEKPQGIFEKIQ